MGAWSGPGHREVVSEVAHEVEGPCDIGSGLVGESRGVPDDAPAAVVGCVDCDHAVDCVAIDGPAGDVGLVATQFEQIDGSDRVATGLPETRVAGNAGAGKGATAATGVPGQVDGRRAVVQSLDLLPGQVLPFRVEIALGAALYGLGGIGQRHRFPARDVEQPGVVRGAAIPAEEGHRLPAGIEQSLDNTLRVGAAGAVAVVAPPP